MFKLQKSYPAVTHPSTNKYLYCLTSLIDISLHSVTYPLCFDTNIGFLQWHQGHRPHDDDDDKEVEDNNKDDREGPDRVGTSALDVFVKTPGLYLVPELRYWAKYWVDRVGPDRVNWVGTGALDVLVKTPGLYQVPELRYWVKNLIEKRSHRQTDSFI